MDADSAGLAAYMQGYARLANLSVTERRLKELEPEVAALLADMRKLWTIPIGEVEAAIGFRLERLADDA